MATSAAVELKTVGEELLRGFNERTVCKMVESTAQVWDLFADVRMDPQQAAVWRSKSEYFEGIVERLADLQTQAESTAAAISQFQGSLDGGDLSRAAERLQAAIRAQHEAHPHHGRPRQTKGWATWCNETGAQAVDGGGDDDDLQIAGGGRYLSLRCTLTQKSIFELAEPVEDAAGFIWEREAIVQFIQQNGGCAPNPAKTDVMISATELKPCRRVLRDSQRHKTQKVGTQGGDAVLEDMEIL